MKQKEIQTLKVINVRRVLILIGLICSINIGHSQTKIVGTYVLGTNSPPVHGAVTTNYTFYKSGLFEKNTFGQGGKINYGKGHYSIKNDSLILNFDLTELKENSFHKSKVYYNSTDSLQVKLHIYDFERKPLYNIQVWSAPIYVSAESDENGIAILKLKKRKQKEKIMIEVVGEFFVKDQIYINANANYEIDVFLSKNEAYNWWHPRAFKHDIIKYKIIKSSKEEIKLKTQKGTMLLRKKNKL